jgi:serine acetyltransferase
MCLGTGATLVVKIKVGNGTKIVANMLVMSSVPVGDGDGVLGRIIMRNPKTAAGANAAETQYAH